MASTVAVNSSGCPALRGITVAMMIDETRAVMLSNAEEENAVVVIEC